MDPQKLSSLDPKLREAYQRVMGTTIPEPQAAPLSQASAPIPQPEFVPASPTTIPTQQASNFVQMNSEIPAAAPTAALAPNFTVPPVSQVPIMPIKKKGSSIMPVLFVIVGLVFIVIYTLFWTKIFNLKLPFLP